MTELELSCSIRRLCAMGLKCIPKVINIRKFKLLENKNENVITNLNTPTFVRAHQLFIDKR